MTASIALPRLMRIGAGAVRQLPDVLQTLELSRPLVVTDAFIAAQPFCARLLDDLAERGMSAGLFAEATPDPTTASVTAGVRVLNEGDYDCVVGIGGGSPLDTAKAIALLGTRGGRMSDYKAPVVTDSPVLPVIAIPTTAGSGSESTRFSIITDAETDEKMLCPGLALLPRAALVDYELTFGMPPRLTADTGVDALVHAIEAYVSRRATPFTDALAREAMRTIHAHIRTAYTDPDNAPAREAMMLGATQAGIAFSNASVALVHGMSRPIGAHFGVAHGLSNAMLMPAVTAFSLDHATRRYADCARTIGVVDATTDDETAAECLLDELHRLNRDLDVPTPAEHGIDAHRWGELIPLMAEQALESGSPANNPRVPTAEDIEDLYRSLMPET